MNKELNKIEIVISAKDSLEFYRFWFFDFWVIICFIGIILWGIFK